MRYGGTLRRLLKVTSTDPAQQTLIVAENRVTMVSKPTGGAAALQMKQLPEGNVLRTGLPLLTFSRPLLELAAETTM